MSRTPATDGPWLAGPHNSRLGPAIHAFNIPAQPQTCVGSTPTCEAACYARSFLFRLQQERHRHNLARTLQPGFARTLTAEIRRNLIRVVRIHVSGDFHDASYVRQWLEVVQACPGTAFFAYTRSWRSADILTELILLAGRPNVQLWFSEDRDTGQSPQVPGVRRAYLLAKGQAMAEVPQGVDLVFREASSRSPGRPRGYHPAAKRIQGILICPKEQGIDRQVNLTCSTCRICFTPRGRRGQARPIEPT
jgi:hypothetical protein